MLNAIIPATSDDLDEVWQLYTDVCLQQAHDAYGPMWTLDVYPAREDIDAHLREGSLYVGTLGGKIVAAIVVVPHEDDEYAHVPWPSGYSGSDVSVIHLLCVHPSLRGRGVGRELTDEAIRLARTSGKHAIHLDVVPGNLAASRIYQAAGFSHVCNCEVYYEDTGVMEFELYEYVL